MSSKVGIKLIRLAIILIKSLLKIYNRCCCFEKNQMDMLHVQSEIFLDKTDMSPMRQTRSSILEIKNHIVVNQLYKHAHFLPFQPSRNLVR